MASSFLRFLDHTQRPTTVGRTPLDEWSARSRDLYLTTHNTHNRQHIHAPGGIRTHDLSRRAATDLRPRGQWDRQQNQLDALISQIYSWNKTLHVSDSSSVHQQEFFTVHTTMVYVIQVCWQLESRISMALVPSWSCSLAVKMALVPSWSCPQAVRKTVWHIPLLCVQWKTPVNGQRNCQKHVEFHSKNKFEKQVHLVGIIIRNLSRCTVTWTSNISMQCISTLS